MLYFLLFISVLSDTLKKIYNNHFGKECMKTNKDAILFNAISCVGAVLFFILSGAEWKISGFSLGMSLCFATVTTAAQFLELAAMSSGPMSYSILFSYLGMIIPTFFGVAVYKQNLSVLQIVGFILMIATIVLGVDLKKDSRITPKWLLYASGSFVMWGGVGIFQLIHQQSEFAHEINGFLLYSFIITTVLFFAAFYAVPKKKGQKFEYINKKSISLILVSGLMLGIVNKINLYLSGKMASVIFFPVVNGGVIILSGLAAIFMFKEKQTPRQHAGIVLGILAVCFLGI